MFLFTLQKQNFNTNGATDAVYFSAGGRSFLVVTNYQDNKGQTSVMSQLYQWEPANSQFSSLPVQYIDTSGAIAVDAITIAGVTFVAVANHYDSGSRTYELK